MYDESAHGSLLFEFKSVMQGSSEYLLRVC